MGLGAGGRACVLPEAPGLRLCVLDLFTRWGTSSGAGSFDFLCGGVGRIRSGGLSSGSSLMLLFGTTEGADLLQRLCPPTQGRQGGEHW